MTKVSSKNEKPRKIPPVKANDNEIISEDENLEAFADSIPHQFNLNIPWDILANWVGTFTKNHKKIEKQE